MESSRRTALTTVCVLSVFIAYMSALSDHAPWAPDSDAERVVLYGLAGVLNDFTMWLVCVILVARTVATGWRRSAAAGFGWAVITVWLYLLIEGLVFHEGHSEGWGGLVTWTVLAAFGGIVGGLIAGCMQRFPIAVAPLAVLAAIRLRDPNPWHSIIGAMHQVALVLVLLWCVGYWVKRLLARRPTTGPGWPN